MYLFLYCAFCLPCNELCILWCFTCTMLCVGILHYQQVLCQEGLNVSEVTTRKVMTIVQKENFFVEEIKEVELRSRRGKFIYNRTYNPVGWNKVSHFSRRDRAPSRLPMKKLKSLLKKTRKVRRFVWKGILKNTPLSSKIYCYVKNRNGLYFNRYRSNCKSVRFLVRASPKLVRKRRKVYLSSKHKGRGYLGGVMY